MDITSFCYFSQLVSLVTFYEFYHWDALLHYIFFINNWTNITHNAASKSYRNVSLTKVNLELVLKVDEGSTDFYQGGKFEKIGV